MATITLRYGRPFAGSLKYIHCLMFISCVSNRLVNIWDLEVQTLVRVVSLT